MKVLMATIVLLSGFIAQARGTGDTGSAGGSETAFILPQREYILSLKPYDQKDDRNVVVSVNPNLVMGNKRCGEITCFVDLKESGSDLIAVVEAAKEPMDQNEKRIIKEFKIGTIRGDRRVDFSVARKVKIKGQRAAKKFCFDFNIPTIGSSNKCAASSGSYHVELF